MRWTLRSFPQAIVRIANISSGAATKPYRSWTAYCSAKSALRMSSQILALESEASGVDVRVVSYSPGVLDSPMQSYVRGLTTDQFPDVGRFLELARTGQLVKPEDSAFFLWQIMHDPELPYYTERRFESSSPNAASSSQQNS